MYILGKYKADYRARSSGRYPLLNLYFIKQEPVLYFIFRLNPVIMEGRGEITNEPCVLASLWLPTYNWINFSKLERGYAVRQLS